MIHACITGGKVVNVLVADQSFIDAGHIASQYDSFVDITNLTPMPGVGWSYDGANFTDTRPVPPAPTLTQIVDAKLAAATTFGVNLMDAFKNQNVQLGVTQANMTKTIADATHNLYHYLVTGSLYAAITECDNLSNNILLGTWSPFITAPILTTYKNQIQTFLGVPLT